MPTPNWGKLYREGRCKEIGVPWNDEELKARYELGIPAEYVRDGILTKEDYEKTAAADEKKGVPLSRMTRADLLKKAEELEITDFTNATTDSYLRQEIEKKEAEKPKKKAPAKKKVVAKKLVKKIKSKKK